MSYDLMVFAAEAAPREREEFLDWYDERTEWEEPQGYDDPERSTPALRAWFMEMIETFPAINGPFATDDMDAPALSDYSIGEELIYVAFGWPMAEKAYATAFALAAKHGLGFLDASGESGAVWLPDGKGGLALAHES